MNKFIWAIFMFVILSPVIAISAQQCISFGDLSQPLKEYNAEWDSVDWGLVWSHISVSGIAVCAQTVGEKGDIMDKLEYDATFSNTSNDNVYCWCRMLSPVVSSWVAYGVCGDNETCLQECAVYCADGIALEPDFRTSMIGTLSN